MMNLVQTSMADTEQDTPPPIDDSGERFVPLDSDEPTLELIVRWKTGDRAAIEALLQRCLPPLRRWAHGRLPTAARGHLDTEDLVQDTALQIVRHLETFEPRHVGALQAYLRCVVINRIRDEVRRIGRRPPPLELVQDPPDDRISPEEEAIKQQVYEQYRRALLRLRSIERQMVVARIEMQWSLSEIAHRFGKPSVDAARMAVSRALRRLTNELRAAPPD